MPAHLDLSIVVPVYRSEDCLPLLIDAINDTLLPTSLSYEVILVNDYSPDLSWKVITSLCQSHPNVIGVDLRRNFGQDNAILTGLRLACGQFIAIMDDDLQHHPKYLPALLHKLNETGADVVYTSFQTKRQHAWKNVGSWINGRIAEWIIYKPKDIYLSPYKMIRKEVADLICNYTGPSPYIDGLLFQYTWRVTQIPAEHYPRSAGRGGYTLWRSLGVSARLAFSYSVKPLRILSCFGISLAALGLMLAAVVVFYCVFFPDHFIATSAGWASLMVTFLVISGLQLIFFGILGEYAGRTYLKLNDKPQTSVREILNTVNCWSPAQSQTEVLRREGSVGNKSYL
jgi:polyisoprenyl-phosphate glycosyltransferase